LQHSVSKIVHTLSLLFLSIVCLEFTSERSTSRREIHEFNILFLFHGKCNKDIDENAWRLKPSFCILNNEGFHSAFHEVNLLLKLLCPFD
jgi:hypothetical protein